MTTHLSSSLPPALRGGVRIGGWKPASALRVATRRQGSDAIGVAPH